MEPSSSPKLPYNPASDGFAAKAWECLRRNKEFRRDFSRALREKLEDSKEIWREIRSPQPDIEELARRLCNPAKPINIFESRLAAHPFLQAISGPLFDCLVLPEDRESIESYSQSLNPEKTWPEIHPITQGGLEYGLGRHNAFPVEISDRSAIDPHHQDYSPVTAKNFLASFATEPDMHRAIFIPITVWDRSHKEDILREVSELLGKPLAKDARWLKDNGRALGTKAEWHAFLLVEQWRSRELGGYGITKAANLTAWEIFEEEVFGDAVSQRKESARAFLANCTKLHKYTSNVEKRFAQIEHAIKSVYPVFRPTQSA